MQTKSYANIFTSGCASRPISTRGHAYRQCSTRTFVGTWSSEQKALVPADPASFEPRSESFLMPMNRASFVGEWIVRLHPGLVHFDSGRVSAFCAIASWSGSDDGKEIQPKALIVRAIPGECWHHSAQC